MKDEICQRAEKCPLFNGKILKRVASEDVYKKLYCNSNWANCKRFQISSIAGKCPDSIMPNCSRSIDEILDSMKFKRN